MAFSVCVAADIGGGKGNIEFLFDRMGPSVGQLLSRAQEVFSRILIGRGISRPFIVSGTLIFDDLTARWVPLERSSQIVHNSQVYLFQPDIVDVPGEIPHPVPAIDYLSAYSSPSRGLRTSSPRAELPLDYGPRMTAYPYSPMDIALRSRSVEEQRAALESISRHTGEHIAGGSILREEREKEERKLHLDLDTHRATVRSETDQFMRLDLSPRRSF
jgi:hypothetical protein